VQALRYQGEQAAEIEAELRWQVHPRLSLVGVGVGRARGDGAQSERGQNVRAAGAGYRFLVPRKHGLHMGLDVAAGADDPALYVVFGSAWLRP
jgi:hemolysin activation/secretion protein